jgi:hypothetical protein
VFSPIFIHRLFFILALMNRSGHYKELMMQHELLKARFELRDHYLRFIVREVYENIGQVLSLVRVQIAMMQPDNSIERNRTDETGNLVGQAIRDLRVLCQNFIVADMRLTVDELTKTIEREVQELFPSAQIEIVNKPSEQRSDAGVISFYFVKSLLELIKTRGSVVSIKMNYDEDVLCWELLFMKETTGHDRKLNISLRQAQEISALARRIQLMGGRLEIEISSANTDILKLVMPYK